MMNKKIINEIISSTAKVTDFEYIEKYNNCAKEFENDGDYLNAVINYEYEICYLTKVYSFALANHFENLNYPQTYNGKHFFEIAQKWKEKIVETHNHISVIVDKNKKLFINYEPIILEELLKEQ